MSIGLIYSCKSDNGSYSDPASMAISGEMVAELTAPPFVPKPVGNRKPMKLKVSMEITEEKV